MNQKIYKTVSSKNFPDTLPTPTPFFKHVNVKNLRYTSSKPQKLSKKVDEYKDFSYSPFAFSKFSDDIYAKIYTDTKNSEKQILSFSIF